MLLSLFAGLMHAWLDFGSGSRFQFPAQGVEYSKRPRTATKFPVLPQLGASSDFDITAVRF
jgi:hypothetical protein